MKNRSTAEVVLEELRRASARRRLSAPTGKAYHRWAMRYLSFRGNRDPAEMGDAEVNAFLKDLAASGLSDSTQSQALTGLRFLYREVLDTRLGEVEEIARPHRQRDAPGILSLGEFHRILAHTDNPERLIFQLLFGAGLRLEEAVRLRIRDLDLDAGRIHVRDTEATTTRVTVLPDALRSELLKHLEHVRAVHSRDVREGYGRILIPYALWKENPTRAREWQWQYAFPATRRSRDPRKGAIRRQHISVSTIHRRLRKAVALARIKKSVGCACLRRSFGFHMLVTGTEPELIQELLGYKSAKTVRRQMPAPVRLGGAISSPLDLLKGA